MDNIKRAYHERAKLFHVDNHGDKDIAAVRVQMERIFGEVGRAHGILTDLKQRMEYDAMLSLHEAGVPTDISVILGADQAFEVGKRLLDRSKYSGAYEQFNEAATMNPSDNAFRAYRCWSRYLSLAEQTKDEAPRGREVEILIVELEELASLDKRLDMADVFLGNIARSRGEMDEAADWYELAVKKNRNNQEAATNLRLLKMRERKETTSAFGFIKKFFGK